MRKATSLILVLIFCCVFTGCSALNGANNRENAVRDTNAESSVQVTGLNDETRTVGQSKSNISSTDIARAADAAAVTMRDIASFLETKKEHYPLSDEFIEKYQQSSGGYLDTARKNGLEVNKEKHEPNQKWHFFDSWLYPSIEDGTLTWEASAQSRVYSKLLCPELLLWIYEACEVDPVKVKNAKDVAEQGKSSGISTTTIAKNMRSCVSWEDLEKAIVNRPIVAPTKLSAATTELSIYVNGEKNLNDEIKLIFEPENTTDKRIIWSCGENEYFTLNGATISANKAGSAQITATSAANTDLFVNINVTVSEPPSHSVSVSAGEGYTVTGLQTEYAAGTDVTFGVQVTDSEKQIGSVKVNGAAISAVDKGVYKFVMPDTDVTVNITLRDKSSATNCIYNIVYDMGSYKTARPIADDNILLSMFQLSGEGDGIIQSVQIRNPDEEKVYGGGNGGRGDTAWVIGDVLKFGTTTVNGSITLNLNREVNCIKITGYVAATNAKIQVGDSASTDWTTEADDNRTTTVICSQMNEASKDNVEAGKTSTIEISFTSASSITIATLNKKPLYITSIEFVYNVDTAD